MGSDQKWALILPKEKLKKELKIHVKAYFIGMDCWYCLYGA